MKIKKIKKKKIKKKEKLKIRERAYIQVPLGARVKVDSPPPHSQRTRVGFQPTAHSQ